MVPDEPDYGGMGGMGGDDGGFGGIDFSKLGGGAGGMGGMPGDMDFGDDEVSGPCETLPQCVDTTTNPKASGR